MLRSAIFLCFSPYFPKQIERSYTIQQKNNELNVVTRQCVVKKQGYHEQIKQSKTGAREPWVHYRLQIQIVRPIASKGRLNS